MKISLPSLLLFAAIALLVALDKKYGDSEAVPGVSTVSAAFDEFVGGDAEEKPVLTEVDFPTGKTPGEWEVSILGRIAELEKEIEQGSASRAAILREIAMLKEEYARLTELVTAGEKKTAERFQKLEGQVTENFDRLSVQIEEGFAKLDAGTAPEPDQPGETGGSNTTPAPTPDAEIETGGRDGGATSERDTDRRRSAADNAYVRPPGDRRSSPDLVVVLADPARRTVRRRVADSSTPGVTELLRFSTGDGNPHAVVQDPGTGTLLVACLHGTFNRNPVRVAGAPAPQDRPLADGVWNGGSVGSVYLRGGGTVIFIAARR